MALLQRFIGSMASLGIMWFGVSAWVGHALRGMGRVNLKGFQDRRITNTDGAEAGYLEHWRIPSRHDAKSHVDMRTLTGQAGRFHRPRPRTSSKGVAV